MYVSMLASDVTVIPPPYQESQPFSKNSFLPLSAFSFVLVKRNNNNQERVDCPLL